MHFRLLRAVDMDADKIGRSIAGIGESEIGRAGISFHRGQDQHALADGQTWLRVGLRFRRRGFRLLARGKRESRCDCEKREGACCFHKA